MRIPAMRHCVCSSLRKAPRRPVAKTANSKPIRCRAGSRSSAPGPRSAPLSAKATALLRISPTRTTPRFKHHVERKTNTMTFLAAYTYSKAIDDASGFGDWVNFLRTIALSRSLSFYDVRSNFVARLLVGPFLSTAFSKALQSASGRRVGRSMALRAWPPAFP